MIYSAMFSNAVPSFGGIRLLQKVWNPECRHPASMAIISREIFPLAISMPKTLRRNMASSFFSSDSGATREHPFAVEAAVRNHDMATRVESEQVAGLTPGNIRP